MFACGELDDLKELDKGADVNGKVTGGLTVHAACANGHEPVKEPLARGADTTLANDAEIPLLIMPPQQKQAACLKLVLTDSLKKNNFGRSALEDPGGRRACATIALEHDSTEKIIEA